MGNIEKEIKKLKWDYDDKINDCDKLLAVAEWKKREARDKGHSIVEFVKDIAILDARRQAYVQAKVDFDSLLDCLESI